MEISGQIEEIIYQNEVNGYTIASFSVEEEETTIVGYLPFIGVGDFIKAIGKFVVHQEYGRQFKVDTFEKIIPQTLDALEKYLSNGIVKGIGPATAKKIVKNFGEETISIFRFEPEKLAQIKGITKQKAVEIGQSFNENWELWQMVGFLEKFGIGASSAKKIHNLLGNDAITQIEANPYILVDIVRGVDFKQIDKVAQNMGMEYNNEKRISSGIKYSLILVSYNGNTCVMKDNLTQFVSNLLKVEKEDIENTIINLKVKEEIIIENRQEEQWIYLEPFYKAEVNISEKLVLLEKSNNNKKIFNIKNEIKQIEEKSDIILSDKQKEAIEIVNENNVCVITGGPGTGKTTIIKTIIDIYKKHDKKVVLCAPTGRAAKRMSETTGEEAKTLHRVLEIGKMQEESNIDMVNYDIAPIDADVIVVDEASMIDVFLMNYLIKGIYLSTKLILVGDVDQLPSVGPGSVLKDIIKSEAIPTIYLDQIFRQAAQSNIVLNAHRVNSGEGFIASKEDVKKDFFYIKEASQDKILNQVLTLCKDRLKNYGDYEFFKNIQVITPTKKGMLGTKELNKSLQEMLNPKATNKKERTYLSAIYRIGDRVMQVRNNYDIFWEKKVGEYEAGSGIFNGEFGTIENIDEVERQMKIKFDDEKQAWYAFSDLDQIEHAYSITIHKAQGSEFDVVIIPISPSSPKLLTRNLLYTAITRAKKLLIVIGDSKIIEFMIQNSDNKKRNTGLKFKLEG